MKTPIKNASLKYVKNASVGEIKIKLPIGPKRTRYATISFTFQNAIQVAIKIAAKEINIRQRSSSKCSTNLIRLSTMSEEITYSFFDLSSFIAFLNS